MVLVLVCTSSRSTHYRPFEIPLDGRKRKRVVRVPGFMSWYSLSRFPLLLSRRRVSDETRHANNLYKPPLLSESQESGNHQDKTSTSVSEYTRLGRPALQ